MNCLNQSGSSKRVPTGRLVPINVFITSENVFERDPVIQKAKERIYVRRQCRNQECQTKKRMLQVEI